MRGCVASWHCVFAERIEKAGAILLGKTNSPTMGLRGTCDNYLFGPTRNPFDVRKNAGGSSGGSAAAVADGLVPFAEGTDAGGSIRIPAAWCNVVGFKASFGRVPVVMRPNAFAGDTPFVFEGPISRTVEDAALALNALAGYDPRDPFAIETNEDFLAATAALDQRLEDRLQLRISTSFRSIRLFARQWTRRCAASPTPARWWRRFVLASSAASASSATPGQG